MTNNHSYPVVEAKPLLHAQAILGEGSIWNPVTGQLYWVNIEGRALHVYDPVTGVDRQFPVGETVSTVVPVVGGDVLLSLQSGIHRFNLSTGEMMQMVNPIDSLQYRFNDGKCDPAGRFWVGSLALDRGVGQSALFRIDADGIVSKVLDNLTIPNGLVWSADRKTMYYIDTPTQRVDAFDYDGATGNISHRRPVITIPQADGSPDGMSIDSEGMLWVAIWGGGCVNRYDPQTGNLLQQVRVPAPHVSSCALGGKDLKTLFITTAQEGLTAEELARYPLSGDLFSIEVDVPGVPANFYRPS